MDAPALYPEPNNCLLACATVAIGGAPPVRARTLRREDIEYAASCFKRDLDADGRCFDAYFLKTADDTVEIAAACSRGLLYALRALERLMLPEGAVRKAVIFDYAPLGARAVDLSAAACSDPLLLKNLIRGVAGLKYNAIIADWERMGIAAGDERNELDALCEANGIDILRHAEDAGGLIGGLHGPSFLDWEHRSALPGVAGAAVPFSGEMTPEGLARSGFLYNLAYSATMLWNEDYSNFSWEKTVEPAMRQAYALSAVIRGKTPARAGARDVYPLALAYGGERHARRPELLAVPGSRLPVAFAGEAADGLVFRHALEGPGSPEAGEGRPVGSYVVRYRDGSAEEIPLAENETIGPSGAWYGRRYDAKAHRFASDERLHTLCCFTRPVRRIPTDGRAVVIYEYEWENPKPAVPIDSVELAVRVDAGAAVCVYGVDAANG